MLFIAEPILLAVSRVDSTIVAIIAVVFSNEEPTELADEAVLLIASANSSVSDAEIAATSE